ncbi:MAG: cystathionine beta-lyase [Burkholderiaceae bacterium]|nr:MAG: cystathionine beta-lyase [Burkholderiaceae bacterium]
MKNKQRNTRLIHPEQQPPPGFVSLTTAIERASTVVFPDTAALQQRDWRKEGYIYGLSGTPTSRALEQRLAELEGGRHTLLTSSGLAAITLVYLACLQRGDTVLVPHNVYGPSRDFASHALAQWGIDAVFYDPLDLERLRGLLQANTKLVWVETPGSVTMEVPDLPAIAQMARAADALVAVDHTWSAGLALPVFELGADIAVQALTKFQSGGSDLLMGSVTTRELTLHHRIQRMHMLLGLGVGMDDCYLILRSLPHLQVRFEAHDRAARQVAQWLQGRPEIAAVRHPALAECPGHAVWQRDYSGAGSLFSIVFDTRFTAAQVDAFVDRLTLFKIGFSWGGACSLALPYDMAAIRPRWDGGPLVRLYIGMEDPQDLIDDLQHGLAILT